MFGGRKRRRRSELRLGVQSINYETTIFQPRLSVTPAVKFWQARATKLSGVLTLLLVGGAFYFLFTSPVFFVYEAEIQNNTAVSGREIYLAANIDSQSIFWINPVDVATRVAALPNIKSAAVSVSLPARVAIRVVERRPELLWQTGETIWWVDQEGTIVPPKGDVTGMLRIIDDDRQQFQAGYQIDPKIIKGAQTLRMLAPTLSVIRYSRAQGLTVATPEGWPVYLGDGDEVKAKLVVLTALLADLEERNVTPVYIDVRNPLRPFYKPVSVIRIGQPVQAQGRTVLPTPGPQLPAPGNRQE